MGPTLILSWYPFFMRRETLRWVAILPGAVVGALLSNFLLHWILYFTLARGETISGVDIRPIEHFLYPAVMAFAFVFTGSEIAPKRRFEVAVGLADIYLLFAIGALIYASNVGLKTFVEIRTVGPLVGL